MSQSVADNSPVQISVVIPCLNEERTIVNCVEAALDGIANSGLQGEVIVSDNGSTDESVPRAIAAGARIVKAPRLGYGAALQAANKTGLQFRLGLLGGAITVGAIVVGLSWGAIGVAVGIVASMYVVTTLNVAISARVLGIVIARTLRMLAPSLLAGVIMAVAVAALPGLVGEGLGRIAVLSLQVAAGMII